MTRGPYELDEDRIPLADRRMKIPWTTFEAQIFNLVSHGDRAVSGDAGGTRLIFSSRLKVAQAMLDAYDRAVRER